MKRHNDLPRTVGKFYWTHTLRHFFWLALIWVALFLTGRMTWYVIKPLCYKWFTELFTATPSAEFATAALPTLLVIFVFHLYSDISWTVDYWAWGHLYTKMKNSISRRLYEYVYDQSMDYFKNAEPGKITAQIEKIATHYRDVVDNGMRLILMSAVVVISSSIIFHMNRWVAVALITAIALRVIHNICSMPRLMHTIDRESDASNTLHGKLLDGLSNFPVVKVFAGKTREMRYTDRYRAAAVGASLRTRMMYRISWCPPMYIDSLTLLVIMILCVMGYQNGTMTGADIVFAFASYMTFNDIMSSVTDYIPDFIDAYGTAAQSYRTLVCPITVRDAPDADKLRVPRGQIDIQNVTFGFGRRSVLKNLTITVRPGEKLGIVGVSGAGKTTLINLLLRFFDPRRGRILIDGTDIRTVTQDSLRANISFIPQEPTMFNRTLADNIAYGRAQATPTQIRHAAAAADADTFIRTTANGYDTLVGDRGIKLSGGQRQRIAIARAFIKDAPILILDEATAALDSGTEAEIQNSLQTLTRGRTTIVIAHRLSTLRHMDRIIVLDHGRVVEDGTHTTLLRRKGIYARLWHMQSDGFV